MTGFRLIKCIIGAICLSFTLQVNAINYKKFIEKHDVDDITKNLKSDNPLDFWESLIETNEVYQKFLLDIQIGKAKEAQRRIALFPRFNPQYRPDVIPNMDKVCNDLLNHVGISDKIQLCIVADSTFNALSAYSDDGMVVALNIGVFMAKGITPEVIIAVAAHEYAHCWLDHLLQSEYAYTERERRDKALAGIATGLNIIAAGADAYSSAVLGTEPNTDQYVGEIAKLKTKVAKDLFRYRYRYAREQEYEADLIAYRFLEWAGYGGENYIELLKIIEANSNYSMMLIETQEGDSHPTVRDRISFLTYVQNHPEIRNTKNKRWKKIRKLHENSTIDGIDDIYN